MTRDKQINFRASEEEAERFDRVAAHYGLPVAATIRMLMKERDETLDVERVKEAKRHQRNCGCIHAEGQRRT